MYHTNNTAAIKYNWI